MYLTVVLGVPGWEGGVTARLNSPFVGAGTFTGGVGGFTGGAGGFTGGMGGFTGGAAAFTASVAEAVCVRVPPVPVLVPVIVTAKLPAGVAAVVVTLIVEEVVAALGLKVAVAPLGNPLALKLTVPVKPPDGVILRV
jgi:hypothetical protein